MLKKVGAASAETRANKTGPLRYYLEMHSQITLKLCRYLLMVHRYENPPSQPKQTSMGVLRTKYAFEALSMDHFFLKGVEFLAIVDRHLGMLLVHCMAFKGAKELIRIWRLHCQQNGIPWVVYSDGVSIFSAHETKEFF